MKQFGGFSVNFISTWYPRLCGIASFAEHTANALDLYEDQIRHIKIHPIDKYGLIYRFPIKEKHIIRQMDASSWIEATYMIFASGITMKIGVKAYGIKNRKDLVKHVFSTPRPIPGWKQLIKPILKGVFIRYLCLVVPAVVFGALFEAYVTDLIFNWFYPA